MFISVVIMMYIIIFNVFIEQVTLYKSLFSKKITKKLLIK